MRLIIVFACLAMSTGCTYVRYKDAVAISIMQKRTLVVDLEDNNLSKLEYRSGSDPVVINIPGYGTVGIQEKIPQ